MSKLDEDKMKEICQDVLTNVLTTAANNLVIEATICFNIVSQNECNPRQNKFMKIINIIKRSIYCLKPREKEKELYNYIKAINYELKHARNQAMIYLDTLVIENKNKH